MAQSLNYASEGDGGVVVFLHGMAASRHYWQPVLDLKPAGRLITIDLLGFGESPKPHDVTYDYETHIAAIMDTLEVAGVHGKFTLVAHSMGALLALRLAATNPDRVTKLVLFGLPYYPDIRTARDDITQSKLLWRLAYYGPTSKVLCTTWCKWLRPVTRFIAPLYLPRLPHRVAQDSLKHSWQSYSQSLRYVIEEQRVADDLDKISVPISLLYGAYDKPGTFLKDSRLLEDRQNIEMTIYPGLTHQLPLEKPQLIVDQLER